MSGHSKWSTIKRQKGVADAKRGQLFTKLANAIIVAVKSGGGSDPDSNFKLRLVVDQARAANMPKDNIERAIERGLGKGAGGQLDTVIYEGFGPSGVAFMIEAVTDNKNRTSSEVKSLLERSGGSLGTPGSVSHMFVQSGLIVCKRQAKSIDEVTLDAADCGAEDVQGAGESADPDLIGVEIYTKSESLHAVEHCLKEKGYQVESADLVMQPTITIPISDAETARKVLSLAEKLEELEDIQKVYANFEIEERYDYIGD